MSNSDAIAEFNAAVTAKMTDGMSRQEAIRAVRRENPALHQAYLEASNPHVDFGAEPPRRPTVVERAQIVATFDEGVRVKVDASMDKLKAVEVVARENPTLHAAYIEVTNRRPRA